MAFLVCLLFRESIGVAITKSFVIFVRKCFASSKQLALVGCSIKGQAVLAKHTMPYFANTQDSIWVSVDVNIRKLSRDLRVYMGIG